MTDARRPVEAWFDEYVMAQSDPMSVEAWSRRIADAILAEVAEVADDATLAQVMATAVRAHWASFLNCLTQPAEEIRLVRPAVEFAEEVARRQLPLEVLLQVYRTAQQETWRYITQVVRELADGADSTEVLVHFWERASRWIDASLSASVDVYQAERDRIRQSTDARRLEAVRDALEGRVSDLRELSTRLGGYPLSTVHTALVVQTADDDVVSELERVAAGLAADLGSRRPLVVAPGGRELWCWASTRTRPDLDLLRDRTARLQEQRITVAVGTPGEGVEGFTVSLNEARAAQRIAVRSGTMPPLTLYPDVEVLALIGHGSDGWRRFSQRTLGDLALPSETTQRLRETVHTLLTTGSVDETAQQLCVHKNTVRYRVTQAEEMLGHSVHRTPVELALALRYHATFIAGAAPTS